MIGRSIDEAFGGLFDKNEEPEDQVIEEPGLDTEPEVGAVSPAATTPTPTAATTPTPTGPTPQASVSSPAGASPAASSPSGEDEVPDLDTTVVGLDYQMTFKRLSANAESNLHSLVGMVSPFISIVARVRKSTHLKDVEEFRNFCIEQIRQYEMRHFGLEDNSKMEFYASFGLCCVVDEFVANTPWGHEAKWGSRSMLMEFHKQELGGEVFFDLLDEMMRNPAENESVMEMFFVCLDLGYEGKYAGNQAEKRKLNEVSEKCFKLLEALKDDTEYRLSGQWEGLGGGGRKLTRNIPHWVIFATAAMVIVGVFSWFHYSLNQSSDPVFRSLMEVAYASEALTVIPWNKSELQSDGATDPDLDRQKRNYQKLLNTILNEGVAKELVELIDQPEKTILRLQHPNLFSSGSEQIANRYAMVVASVGESLAGNVKRVDVTGHSDDIPIRSSPRFANNWELSKARAESVQQILAGKLGSVPVKARGLADSRNVVPNNSSENRAKNRRVEIVLYK